MNNFSSEVKQKLNSIIEDMSNNHWLFTQNPGHDFSRQHLGKLSFADTIRMIIGMSSSFPSTTHQFKDDMCILAFDGCHVVYTTNATLIEDYNKPRLADYKGYNHMHLNGFVDVISKSFLDVVIQPGQHPDEREAMRSMLEHFNPDNPEKYIITTDRGYESYDNIFLCELKKLNYVFRVKAPSSSRSLLSSYISELPDEQEEFDVKIKRFFTNKKTITSFSL